ncbi:MAG: DUF2716 domain-containing protein [Chitinophagaceae bacterium]
MQYWLRLPDNAYDRAWDRFYTTFSFQPGVSAKDWPSITTRKPCKKIDIGSFWSNYNEQATLDFIQKGIDAFTAITQPGELIYALDWQHECFYVDPTKITAREMLQNGSGASRISFLPDGDYYIFITKDFENVWFGHPWEQTVTLIGNQLITAFDDLSLKRSGIR